MCMRDIRVDFLSIILIRNVLVIGYRWNIDEAKKLYYYYVCQYFLVLSQ